MEDCIKALTLCAVCRDTMVNPQMLQCMHSFCKACIQRVISDESIVCPYCKTATRDVDIKNDFKTQQLIEAQSTSSDTYTFGEQAAYHRKELKLIKAGFQKEVDAIVQDNEEFTQVVLSKMRATKRTWDKAFDTEIHQAEQFLKEQMDEDRRVLRLRHWIQDLDAKIMNVPTMPSRRKNKEASVVRAFWYTKRVEHLDAPTGKFDANATQIWRNWQVAPPKPDIAKTAAFLLNPCSSKFLKSKKSTFRQCDMSSNMYEHHKFMLSKNRYYRPFIDGKYQTIYIDLDSEISESSESSADEE